MAYPFDRFRKAFIIRHIKRYIPNRVKLIIFTLMCKLSGVGLPGENRLLTEKSFKAFNEGNFKKADRIIDYIINRFKEVPDSYRRFLRDALAKLCYLKLDWSGYEKMQRGLTERTRVLDASAMNIQKWLDLQYLSIRFGMFQASMAFRLKAEERAYCDFKQNQADASAVISLFSAAIEKSEFGLAREYLGRARGLIDKDYYSRMHYYYLLCGGGDLGGFDLKRLNLNEKDEEYMDYISGKSIAIVGPADSNKEEGEEIDSSDIVIRNAYKGREYMPNARMYGRRTDVSYYNLTNILLHIANQTYGFLNDIRWAVLEGQEKYICKAQTNIRCPYFLNDFYFCGHPATMQVIVFDILHFYPRRIKVFKTNFFLSPKTHYEGYYHSVGGEQLSYYFRKGGWLFPNLWPGQVLKTGEEITTTGGFAYHDMLSQTAFLRNLWQNKRIEVDDDCARVLAMSNEEYLMAMENTHIKPIMDRGGSGGNKNG